MNHSGFNTSARSQFIETEHPLTHELPLVGFVYSGEVESCGVCRKAAVIGGIAALRFGCTPRAGDLLCCLLTSETLGQAGTRGRLVVLEARVGRREEAC